MAQLDLRPLSAGEIIDRTFTLFRRHFLLFVGITAVPQVFVLAFQLARIFSFGVGRQAAAHGILTFWLIAFLVLAITYIATLFTQGATIYAVTDLYLNRQVSVSDCLKRAWSEIGTLFGVAILNGLAVLAGFFALIVGAFYVLCRLLVSVPVAVIEQRGPQDAISRSWNLTRDNFGRALLLLLFYMVIGIVAGTIVGVPAAIAGIVYRNNMEMLVFWTAASEVLGTLLNIVTVPILLILTCVFYFDLRVRKEGFDLQFLMDPTSERITPPGSGSIPTIL